MCCMEDGFNFTVILVVLSTQILAASPQYPKAITVYENGASTGGEVVILEAPCVSYGDLVQIFSQHLSSKHPFAALLSNSPVFFSGYGQKVRNSSSVQDGGNIYVVPRWNQFIWPTKGVGHRVVIADVQNANGKAVELETIEVRPR